MKVPTAMRTTTKIETLEATTVTTIPIVPTIRIGKGTAMVVHRLEVTPTMEVEAEDVETEVEEEEEEQAAILTFKDLKNVEQF